MCVEIYIILELENSWQNRNSICYHNRGIMQDGIDSLQSARGSSAAGAARGKGGYSLSQKRVSPFKSPERKVYIASEQLEELQCLPMLLPARGVAAFGVARRFDLLLLSAAALPVSR